MRLNFFFIFIISFGGCKKSSDFVTPEISFYHWKNEINLSTNEINYLQDLAVKRLYLRFFDVDWDTERQEPIPISIINISSSTNLPSTIIPTVFITNRTFLKIKNSDILNFADKILLKISNIQEGLPNVQIPEIQIDCDWSGKSRENYFHFLAVLKKKLHKENKILSVTIRLHQLKYPDKTGIPPADRGTLMCYNVEDLQKWDTENSILNDKTTSAYLKNDMTYGLSLDFALPVFRWGVLFRDGKMIKLLNQLENSELSDQNFYTTENNNRYTVRQSTYLHGHYLYPNDKIRLESVSSATLKTVTKQLKYALPSNQRSLILYHLDSLIQVNYPASEIKEIQRIFGEVK